MRLMFGLLLVVAGCGPAVDPESGSSGADGSAGTAGPAPGSTDTGNPTAPNPTTGDPTDPNPTEPMPTTVADTGSESGDTSDTVGVGTEGEYYAILSAIIAENTPFQFVGTVKASDTEVSMILTPLSLDVNSIDTPRELVPPPIELTGLVDPDGVFLIDVPEVLLLGVTNPITGSDIVASLRIEGVVEDDLICGRVSGMVTVPANIDLTGSAFSAMRIELGPNPAPNELPLPADIGCP